MRLSVFNEGDRVLLLGEGNFSFSTALSKHNLGVTITSSCYESSAVSEQASKNIRYLQSNGVFVVLGVDATSLSSCPELKSKRFDKILFNFPHVCSKMRLDKNRDLLRRFFVSSGRLLEANGEVLVTLCGSQGGTTFDDPRRRWDDTWKIREMAAHGDFVLTSVEPFCGDLFEGYEVTGYRGLDKKFHASGALTHFFSRVAAPTAVDFAPQRILTNSSLLEQSLSSSTWVGTVRNDKFDVNSLSPPVFDFDVTFTVPPNFDEINFFTILYNNAGRIVQNVEFVRSYEFPDSGRQTRTYRLTYHSDKIPLYRGRVVDIHNNHISSLLEEKLGVTVSR